MPLREPKVGDVFNYRYLWVADERKGQQEGTKPRPALIVGLIRNEEDGFTQAFVLPITHTKPKEPEKGYLLPRQAAILAGLDHDINYVVYSELNHFNWPGFDLEKIRGNPPTFRFGRIDLRTTTKIRSLLTEYGLNIVER